MMCQTCHINISVVVGFHVLRKQRGSQSVDADVDCVHRCLNVMVSKPLYLRTLWRYTNAVIIIIIIIIIMSVNHTLFRPMQ